MARSVRAGLWSTAIVVALAAAAIAAQSLGLLPDWRRTSGPLTGSAPDSTAEPSVDGLADAWRAVAARPDAPEPWIRLGEQQHALDQSEAAERSYRTAIELGDPGGEARARLGFLLYGVGRDRDALALLDAALAAGAELPMLRFVHAQLRNEVEAADEAQGTRPAGGGADPLPAAGVDPTADPEVQAQPPGRPDLGPPPPRPGPTPPRPCRAPLRRLGGDSTFIADLRIEGLQAELIVDTGASLTVITRDLAEALGVPLDWGRSLHAVTANGTVEFPTAVLGRVELAGRAVDELRVAVCEDCVERVADGLLGLDLQTAFGLGLDLAREELSFSDCQ